jgi:Na+-driven multidrug efflux pump
VSLSSNVLFNVFAISHIVYIGTLATAARRVGAGELVEAFNAGLHGICLGAVLGLAMAVVGWLTAPPKVAPHQERCFTVIFLHLTLILPGHVRRRC